MTQKWEIINKKCKIFKKFSNQMHFIDFIAILQSIGNNGRKWSRVESTVIWCHISHISDASVIQFKARQQNLFNTRFETCFRMEFHITLSSLSFADIGKKCCFVDLFQKLFHEIHKHWSNQSIVDLKYELIIWVFKGFFNKSSRRWMSRG